MRYYTSDIFEKILGKIENNSNSYIDAELSNNDIISLQYFLTRNYYYAVIVDDYPFEIKDKDSLLEALYYQARLITVHDLNWDAIQEGISDLLKNFLEFNGICLLFKTGIKLKINLQKEFNDLEHVIQDLSNSNMQKKIKIILF